MTQYNDWSFSPDAMTFTFTGFAAQVGPGMEHSPTNSKSRRRAMTLKRLTWMNEKGLRFAAMFMGIFAIGYGASKGLDGALIAAGSTLIGYSIGRKA